MKSLHLHGNQHGESLRLFEYRNEQCKYNKEGKIQPLQPDMTNLLELVAFICESSCWMALLCTFKLPQMEEKKNTEKKIPSMHETAKLQWQRKLKWQ